MPVHKTEDALKFQPEWLIAAPAIIGDAVITTDIQGRITSLNSVAESLTGWMQAEAVNLSLETASAHRWCGFIGKLH